jgi:hypothetical protein
MALDYAKPHPDRDDSNRPRLTLTVLPNQLSLSSVSMYFSGSSSNFRLQVSSQK